ncbi:kinase-like domain-containing protein [Paraphoma chrysanthemicola]|uniref:non-specific serine/threonine protein kinase n=1 Tax=Paraphoma chrysanthemicola TaxID=798071 RepID=A0A8K0VWP9_9PLEO|nr:kinase-like domain-containing protein [Paraphoma chrysanthemicola]
MASTSNAPSSHGWLCIKQGTHLDDIDTTRLPHDLVQNLGHGGDCIIEEVRHRETGLRYAHKVFKLSRRHRARLTQTFKNELKVARCLEKHRHMPKIFASYTSKLQLGLYMSPVANGGDMDRFLGEFRELKANPSAHGSQIKAITRILEQALGCLADGLLFMRRKKIRHKDIKLHNILIHCGRVLYTDFGISFDHSNPGDNSSTDGPTALSARFAAPEVLKWLSRNSSSDVFSLGCVYIEIFSAITDAIDYDDEQSFSSMMPEIHQQLDAASVSPRLSFLPEIIISMTQHDPRSRWAADRVRQNLVTKNGFCCSECYTLKSSKGKQPHEGTLASSSSTASGAIESPPPLELIENLGHGHSGIVEKVRDRSNGQIFARKTFSVTPSTRRGLRSERQRLFENEIAILHRLKKHRHIIQIFATYTNRERLGLLLYPVAKSDLEGYLLRYHDLRGSLTVTQSRSMTPTLERAFGCLSNGLAFMHKNGIRHKDVKPRNILVHEGKVLFTDFGYSMGIGEDQAPQTEVVRRYTAPETIRNERRGTSSDVFSLGCVFVEIVSALVGQPPIDPSLIFSRDVEPILETLNGLTTASSRYAFLQSIITSMLEVEQTRRMSAAMIASLLLTQPGFSCDECRRDGLQGCQHES